MHHSDKRQFLIAYGFPAEWDLWGLYPDELFQGQLQATADDEEPHPDEHLRYGAFIWWLRKDPSLSRDVLVQLCHLAALDPDPPMAGAALHDILFHPMADEGLVQTAARLAEDQKGWSSWSSSTNKEEVFGNLLSEGRAIWAERHAAHRVANDLQTLKMAELELRELCASGMPLVLRGLAEHPNLPRDLLLSLSKLESGRFAKVIRSLASRRLAGGKVDPTDYAEKYSKDPWSWPRAS